MASDGQELIRQLVDNPAYRAKSDEAVPAEFKVPNEAPHPMFVQVDFGLVRDARGELQPKLVELQAFPSLYAYQGPLAEAYIDVYGLDSAIEVFLERAGYFFVSRTVAAGDCRVSRSRERDPDGD